MIKQIRELCNRCHKQFEDILKNINNYRYCKDCSNELFKLGINLRALKSISGKSKKLNKKFNNFFSPQIF